MFVSILFEGLEGMNLKHIASKISPLVLSKDKLSLVYHEVGSHGKAWWRPRAYVFNVAVWKRGLLKSFLNEFALFYRPLNTSVYKMMKYAPPPRNTYFIVWGMSEPEDLRKYSEEFNVPIFRVEDGFFRSIGLGANHIAPLSICFDKKGIYFDSSKPSDLEDILSSYDFHSNRKLAEEAEFCMDQIRTHGLSKYNLSESYDIDSAYGEKIRRRVLVLGQVEDDASLVYGCERIFTNAELVRQVFEEEPEAQIIFKNHPDIIAGRRKELSSLAEIGKYAQILNVSVSMKDALKGVDRVYTQTSLGGFEALIHGVSVTCFGAPFYSGWGLTDDRQKVERRIRSLSLNEVFAGAYILYPRYRKTLISKLTLKTAIEEVRAQMDEKKLEDDRQVTPYSRLVSLATARKVNIEFVEKSQAKRIVVFTDNEHGLKRAEDISKKGRNVLVVFPNDETANRLTRIIAVDFSNKITLTSIHKMFGVAFSDVERAAVSLSNVFGGAFKEGLRNFLGRSSTVFSNVELREALGLSLEDFLYNECLRSEGIRALLENSDNSIVLLIEDVKRFSDVCQMITYHAKLAGRKSGVFISAEGFAAIEQLGSGVSKNFVSDGEEGVETQDVVDNFHAAFWKVQLEVDANYRDKIIICGNILKDNYAYAPTSEKIIDYYASRNQPTLLLHSSIANLINTEDMKEILLVKPEWKHVVVYQGDPAYLRNKYDSSVSDGFAQMAQLLHLQIVRSLELELPLPFLSILVGRLKIYFDKLPITFTFLSEMAQSMGSAKLFATSMDRIATSRMVAAVAKAYGVPTIGLQPQIISTSPRYQPSSVKKMGVLDTPQKATFLKLANSEFDCAEPVGTINIHERLLALQEGERNARGVKKSNVKTLFFVMQHSNSEKMIRMAYSIKNICLQNQLSLIVKPHPHQEVAVFNKVKNIFSDLPGSTVLSPKADTYAYLPSADIVIGLFSSVLLEAAIFGKDVVVAAFDDLDESIDFSNFGLAVSVKNDLELGEVLSDLIKRGDIAQSLQSSREQYLRENPHLLPPYSLDAMDRFLGSALTFVK